MVDLKEVTILDVPLLQGKEARIQAVCTKAIKSFWGYCMHGKKLEWQYRYRWCCIPAQKRRCDPYLSTNLEEAQLHCYLESCACVAAAATTACAIRQHDDHLRFVSAHISGGVHS